MKSFFKIEIDKLKITQVFKKSVYNTKEKEDRRKNSGCYAIFGGMPIST